MIVLVVVVPLLVAAVVVAGRRRLRPGRPPDLRRFAPALAGVAVVAALFAAASGGESTGFLPVLAVVALVPLAGLALLRARPEPAVAEAWSAPSVGFAGAGQAGRPAPPPARSVALALGGVEARELASSPWFGAGIGFCALIVVMFGFVFAGDNGETWAGFVELAPWFAHPLVGMVVVGAHRAVTRAARDGTDELFDTCPSAQATRAAGFLWSAVVPVAALTACLVALGAAVAVNSPGLHGPLGAGSAAVALAAVVLGAGGVALGVALGRWVPFALAPVIVVIAVGFATIGLNGVGGRGWNPLVQLATAPAVEESSPVFADQPSFWHLLWVAALTVVVGGLALARHRRDRPLASAVALAAIVALVSGVAVTRPLAAGPAARIAGRVAHPEALQDCQATTGPVEVCAFPFHREVLDRSVDQVAPVAAALPAGAGPFTLRQVYDDDLDELPPAVQRLLGPADLVRPPGEIPLGFVVERDILANPAYDLALTALGLPLEADQDLLPTVVAGEARGVVALWLATRGRDPAEALTALARADPASADPFERGALEADPCSVPSVVWSAQDLAAARTLFGLPEAQVRETVAAGWRRWSDPRTGTDELLAALGLPPVGPFDEVVARAGQPC